MADSVATAAEPDPASCDHEGVKKDSHSATYFLCPKCKKFVNNAGHVHGEPNGTRGGVVVETAPPAAPAISLGRPLTLDEKVQKFREKEACAHTRKAYVNEWGFWCDDCKTRINTKEKDKKPYEDTRTLYDWDDDADYLGSRRGRIYAFGGYGGDDHGSSRPTSPYHGNSLRIIHFYPTAGGGYAFDDPAVNCRGEAMVSGMPAIMDELQDRAGMEPGAFKCTFSDNPFPGSQLHLEWIAQSSRGDKSTNTGNWYRLVDGPQAGIEGWLCPALFKFFKDAPKHIYAKAEEWLEEEEEVETPLTSDEPKQAVVDAVPEPVKPPIDIAWRALDLVETCISLNRAAMFLGVLVSALAFAVGTLAGYLCGK